MTTSEFNKCVDEYSNAVYRFLLKNLGNSDTAQDLVQDSFARLWENHGKLDAKKAKSYLFTCAYNAMIDLMRREKRLSADEPTEANSPTERTDYSDLNAVLHQALMLLPDAQRSVILLRDYEGYSYDEIAEITSLSLSAVKVYIFRARVFLKDYLSKVGACPENYLVEEF